MSDIANELRFGSKSNLHVEMAYSVEYAARNPEARGRLRWLRLLFFAEAWKHATSA